MHQSLLAVVERSGVAMEVRKVMFGAGCFWGVQSTFDAVQGVLSTVVGYSGGRTESPSYRQVCTGTTGHAEVVLVEYDAQKVTFEALLDVFWACHDSTALNRQGPDVGHQYRSVIFCFDEDELKLANAIRDVIDKSEKLGSPIVTEILPAGPFYSAEEYHQKYNEKHGRMCGIR